MAKIFVRDLQPGQTYGIQLRADDGDAQSEWSPIHYFTTTVATVGPQNVTGLTWVTNGTSFLATWNAVTHNTDGSEIMGPVVYEVQITDGTNFLTYRPTQPRFDFSYEMNRDGFGVPKPALTIYVRAVNSSGVKSPTPTSAFALNDPPEPPTDFSAQEFTNQVVVSWEPSPSEDVVAYIVYAGESGFTPAEGNVVWSGAGFSATHYSTEYNTDFYYKVAAIDVFGTASDYLEGGPFSPLGIVGSVDDTPPSNPTGVTATTAPNADPSGQYTDLTVTWTGPTEASDPSLSTFNVRYGYDGTTWNYTKVPSDQLTTKIPRLLAGGSIYVQVQAEDFSANRSAWVQAGTYPVAGNKDTTGPSQPAAPSGSVGVQRIQATHNLTKQSGGSLESDLDYFEVYAGTSSGFTANSSSMLGTMTANVVAVQTFDVPAAGSGTTQNWYLKVIAVDKAGNKSAVSNASAVLAVGLIATANIGDLAVTNAKINDLGANKITAGTGFINDLTVKSKFTLGDASTVGVIETFGYVPGVSGAHFSKNLIEINQGSIAAAALKIQNSANLLPSQYAGFEYNTKYYTEDNQVYSENLTVGIVNTDRKYEVNSLSAAWTTTGGKLFLGNTDVDYNTIVEPGDYIYSFYVKSTEVSGTTQLQPKVKMDTGAIVSGSVHTATVGNGWERFWGVVTVPSGVAQVLVFFEFPETTGAVLLDGIQFERKIGALTTPSQWKPPGITTVDGGAVKTGFLDGEFIRADTITVDHLDVDDGIDATWMTSKFIISNEMMTAETGKRWYVGPEGMKMFDANDVAYISFPTDSKDPEFSGVVNATGLNVSELSKLSDVEVQKAKTVTLNMGTTAPSTGPTMTPYWTNVTLLPADADTVRIGHTLYGPTVTLPKWKEVRGMDMDANYIYVMEPVYVDTPFTEGSRLWIWDRVTRKCVRTVGYLTSTDWRWIGITVVGGRYFTIHDTPTQTVDEIYPFTDNTRTTRYTAIRTYDTIGRSTEGGTDRLLLAWSEGSPEGPRWKINHLNMTAWTIDTLSETTPNGNFNTLVHGVYGGNFDYGVNRVVIAGESRRWLNTFSGSGAGTTRTHEGAENWDVRHGENQTMRGATWDGTNFWSLASDGVLTKYSGIKWTTGSNKLWAAVKWRNTIGNATTPYETALGAKSSITDFVKRQFLDISHVNVPTDNDPVVPNDEPDSMGIYLVRSDTTPATGDFKFQLNTARFVNISKFSTIDESGLTPPATLAFPSGGPSKIISSVLGGDGNPLIDIRADGFSRMNQLVVNSTSDANANPGNTPALRIGSVTGNHLRIDGNEIISMNSDSTQGLFMINGGGTVQIGAAGRTFRSIDYGSSSYSFNGSGIATISHSLNGTPVMVLVNCNARFNVQAFNYTSSTFQVEIINNLDNNPPAAANRALDWIAVR